MRQDSTLRQLCSCGGRQLQGPAPPPSISRITQQRCAGCWTPSLRHAAEIGKCVHIQREKVLVFSSRLAPVLRRAAYPRFPDGEFMMELSLFTQSKSVTGTYWTLRSGGLAVQQRGGESALGRCAGRSCGRWDQALPGHRRQSVSAHLYPV